MLKGWADSNQSELCLKKYFDIVSPEEINIKVQEIYNQKDNFKAKYDIFLNVLLYLNQKYKEADFLNISRNIAYETISEKAESGDFSNLHLLKKFLPDDRLIGPDCNRFINTNQSLLNPQEPATFYLDININWFKAICLYDQFVVFGKKDKTLHLARGNWYGNIEYYSWNETFNFNFPFKFVSNPLCSNHILVQAVEPLPEMKTLPKNKYFAQDIVIQFPGYINQLNDFFPNEVIGAAITNDKEIAILKSTKKIMRIENYTFDGVLRETNDCKIESDKLNNLFENSSKLTLLSEMTYVNGTYYTFRDNRLISISGDYTVKIIYWGDKINMLSIFYDYHDFKMVIRTDKDFLIFDQKDKKLGMDKFFKQNSKPIDIKFISANQLVIAEKFKGYIYNFQKNKYDEIHKSSLPIVSILQTNKRNQCAFLEDSGKITVYNI